MAKFVELTYHNNYNDEDRLCYINPDKVISVWPGKPTIEGCPTSLITVPISESGHIVDYMVLGEPSDVVEQLEATDGKTE